MPSTTMTSLRRIAVLIAVLAAALTSFVVVGPSASATTSRNAALSLSASTGLPGTAIFAKGHGFGRKETGTLTFGSQAVARFRTDTRGRFRVTFSVPQASAVTHAVGAATRSAATTRSFRVSAPASGSKLVVGALLTEPFAGADGVFVSETDFYGGSSLGLLQNPTWLATSGSMSRVGSTGRATFSNPYFRMWTRQTDLAFTKADMDLRFNGWYGGSDGWHGVNLWLNRSLCVPQPDCSKVNDRGGDAGYVIDFLNRDGSFVIQKKTAGPTSGGTYHQLAGTTFRPVTGQSYRIGGRVTNNGDGTATIQALVNGVVKLQVIDAGVTGGPILTGGRVGLRGDYADFSVDNIVISK